MSREIISSTSEQIVGLNTMLESSGQQGWSIKHPQPKVGQLAVQPFAWKRGQTSMLYESLNRCQQEIEESPPGMLVMLIPDSNQRMLFNGQWLDDSQMIVAHTGNEIQLSASRESQFLCMQVPVSLVINGFSNPEKWQEKNLKSDSVRVISDNMAIAHLHRLILLSRVPRHTGRWLLTTEQSLVANLQHLLAFHCMNSTELADRVRFRRAFRLTLLDLYFDSHLQDRIPMSKMTEIVCMSERSFERWFKGEFDMTPTCHIKRRRLEKAREDLAKRKMLRVPIAQIALDNGFRHLGRFSTNFRKHFGQTPSQFRSSQCRAA